MISENKTELQHQEESHDAVASPDSEVRIAESDFLEYVDMLIHWHSRRSSHSKSLSDRLRFAEVGSAIMAMFVLSIPDYIYGVFTILLAALLIVVIISAILPYMYNLDYKYRQSQAIAEILRKKRFIFLHNLRSASSEAEIEDLTREFMNIVNDVLSRTSDSVLHESFDIPEARSRIYRKKPQSGS